ncbi:MULTISPECIES: hypothetical protein [unclassified Shewanella]|uniref:hypothetical protein n=1 Tax=unclassified Shewanella TaxID=196818 RepID=UPI00354B7876
MFSAAKVTIYIIVVKSGLKRLTISRVARKYKVRKAELTELVESSIPICFFRERARKAKAKYENSFYKLENTGAMTKEEKEAAERNIKSIRQILKPK